MANKTTARNKLKTSSSKGNIIGGSLVRGTTGKRCPTNDPFTYGSHVRHIYDVTQVYVYCKKCVSSRQAQFFTQFSHLLLIIV